MRRIIGSETLSERQKFQEILKEIRRDLEHIFNLFQILVQKACSQETLQPSQELKEWIYDTFLDKVYETNAKIKRFLIDVRISEGVLDDRLENVKLRAERVADGRFFVYPYELNAALSELESATKNYAMAVESLMSFVRKSLHENSWKQLEKLKTENYLIEERRAKFVKARDELQNALQAIGNKRWDDVLNHLRTAIDLAIKEKFGFQKIHPMKQFLEDADKHDFPLPSYTMIYDFFDEGSHRIHSGKIHTPWECQRALSFVTDFIDGLDLIEISPKQIDDFRKKCKAVS